MYGILKAIPISMKRKSVCISVLIACLTFGTLFSQDFPAKKDKYYAWINLIQGESMKKGHLIGLDNENLYYVPVRDLKQRKNNREVFKFSIPVDNIQNLEFRKDKNVMKGVVIGGVTGGVILGALAAIDNEYCRNCFLSFSDAEVFTGGFILGMIPGAIIGALVGAKRFQININGDYKIYTQEKSRIKKLIYP